MQTNVVENPLPSPQPKAVPIKTFPKKAEVKAPPTAPAKPEKRAFPKKTEPVKSKPKEVTEKAKAPKKPEKSKEMVEKTKVRNPQIEF